MKDRNLILNKEQIVQKVKRIAYEVYEQNYKEKEMVIAGLDPMGYQFAQLLGKELEALSPIKVTLVRVTLDKTATSQCEVTLDVAPSSLKNKCVLITDDVLNTGRALAYSMKPFLEQKVKKLQTAVLVDRNHHIFPVNPDYVGYSLATTLKEHIEVSFKKTDYGVYLM